MQKSVTVRIIEEIAESEGVDPTELDFSLQDYIDADALRLLVEHEASSWTVTFEVDTHEVVLSGDGQVQVDSHSEINA